ncbi:hypothetical protein B0T26DRAFT_634073 [Lasiosphaeria miniovina]|uniref:Uncharacterized protein n=1 Tax=Lasiosphaeria miniovina TaxID=1954250 RepID=A0AA40EC68_9PEZI|nr:uncharacterized protein B0T26DRAFT_634073 [Lasiosphaeria miniovina]KAK0734600.1 hypothetical protein B0T26DRAFT_634073 [Lasiosphaeria miniovina]
MPFKNLFKKSSPAPDETKDGASSPSSPTEPKRSLYQRFRDSKTGEISEEDVLKYTGKSKSQIMEWAKNEPGVAGNRAAGTLTMGETTGFGGLATAEGYGGWGPNSNAPLKFPPKQPAGKKVTDEDSDGQ